MDVRSIEFATSQLSQKVVQCSSFPILGRKLFYQSVENFDIQTGFLIKILGLCLN